MARKSVITATFLVAAVFLSLAIAHNCSSVKNRIEKAGMETPPPFNPPKNEPHGSDLQDAQRICSSSTKIEGTGKRFFYREEGIGATYAEATIDALRNAIEKTALEIKGLSVVENHKLFADTIAAHYKGLVEFCAMEKHWEKDGLKHVLLDVVVHPEGVDEVARKVVGVRVAVKLGERIRYASGCSDNSPTTAEVISTELKNALLSTGNYRLIDENYIRDICENMSSYDIQKLPKAELMEVCEETKRLYEAFRRGGSPMTNSSLKWGLLADVMVYGDIEVYRHQNIEQAGYRMLSFRARTPRAIKIIDTSNARLIKQFNITPLGWECDGEECKAVIFQGNSCYTAATEVLKCIACALKEEIVNAVSEYKKVPYYRALVKIHHSRGVGGCGMVESQFSKIVFGLTRDIELRHCAPNLIVLSVSYTQPLEIVAARLEKHYKKEEISKYYMEIAEQ